MKHLKIHEQFGRIIEDHFENVEPSEFKSRLYEASHGEFGEKARADDAPPASMIKRAVRKLGRAAVAVGNRILAILHLA